MKKPEEWSREFFNGDTGPNSLSGVVRLAMREALEAAAQQADQVSALMEDHYCEKGATVARLIRELKDSL